jgi:hypothetical protein
MSGRVRDVSYGMFLVGIWAISAIGVSEIGAWWAYAIWVGIDAITLVLAPKKVDDMFFMFVGAFALVSAFQGMGLFFALATIPYAPAIVVGIWVIKLIMFLEAMMRRITND